MYKKLKKLLNFPTKFTFKIICFNKKNVEKKIFYILKKKKIKIEKKNIIFSKNKKYLSISIKIFCNNFNSIKFIYKNISKLNFIKIIL
ncbi:MAG: DUF493 family protein [Buchnera aphidicola (Periphyllus acericola)]|uniref:DUF493 family protein n=1 Tax=Buchnera aphidicola TaxID=9 RepID=UPI003CC8B14E|nr:DUF493 family protein [Buchnera aphidicola (Periphyllus acericola)]